MMPDRSSTLQRAVGLKGQKGWQEYAKSGEKPEVIPANPYSAYKDAGWLGWGAWLGIGNVGAPVTSASSMLCISEWSHTVHRLGM
jgi:hypothetical protein